MSKKLLNLLLVVMILAVLAPTAWAAPPGEGPWEAIVDLGLGQDSDIAPFGDGWVVAWQGVHVKKLSPNGEVVQEYSSPGWGYFPKLATRGEQIVLTYNFPYVDGEGGVTDSVATVQWSEGTKTWEEVGPAIIGAQDPNIKIGPNGKAYLVYAWEGKIYLLRENPEGWEGVSGSESGLELPHSCSKPQVQVNANNGLFVACTENLPAKQYKVRMVEYAEGSWTDRGNPYEWNSQGLTNLFLRGEDPCVAWLNKGGHCSNPLWMKCFNQMDGWYEIAGSATNCGISGDLTAIGGGAVVTTENDDFLVAFTGLVNDKDEIHLHHLDPREGVGWIPYGDQPISGSGWAFISAITINGPVAVTWQEWRGDGWHVLFRQAPSLPDLTVGNLHFHPENPEPNFQVSALFNVCDQNRLGTGGFWMVAEGAKDGGTSQELNRSWHSGLYGPLNLCTGVSMSIEFDQTGEWEVTVKVDTENHIAETDEGNNSATAGITVGSEQHIYLPIIFKD